MLKEVNFLEYKSYDFFQGFETSCNAVYERACQDIKHTIFDKERLKYALACLVKSFDLQKNQLNYLVYCDKDTFISEIQNIYQRFPASITNVCSDDWDGFVPICSGDGGLFEEPEWMYKKLYIDDGVLYPVYSDSEFSVHMFTNVGHKITNDKKFYKIRNAELRGLYDLHERYNDNGRGDVCFDFETLRKGNITDFKQISKEEAIDLYNKNKNIAIFVSGEFKNFINKKSNDNEYAKPEHDPIKNNKKIFNEKSNKTELKEVR